MDKEITHAILGVIFGALLVAAITSVINNPIPDERMGAELTGHLCGVWEYSSDDISDEACLGFCEDTFRHPTQEKRCIYGYTERIVRQRIVESHGSAAQ